MSRDFVTVINCMDGRVQAVVIEYMKRKFDALYVDSVTVAGPSKMLAENRKKRLIKDIKFRISISVEKHDSDVIAVVGHFDCAMIKTSDEDQIKFVKEAVNVVRKWYDVEVIGLWVNDKLEVIEL